MKELVETVYYNLERARLLNDEEAFRLYRRILSSYNKKGWLKEYLTQRQKLGLKYLVSRDSTGVLPFPPKQSLPSQSVDIEKAPESEKELSDLLAHKGMQPLSAALGEPVRLRIREQETQYSKEHGHVDMVLVSEGTVYPCELKAVKADHSLVGQISKYRLHYLLLLPQGIFKEVIAVTIAPEYDTFTLAELKKEGILTLQYSAGKQLHVERV